MELLVVTLAQSSSTEHDPEAATRVRTVAETVRPAIGLIDIQCYQSRGKETYYALLSTWDNEESWHNAQERHNPRQLLLQSAGQQLAGEPEQWFFHYLWGYIRPATSPGVITLQFSTVRPDKIEQAQQLWLKSLSQQIGDTPLAYAFFARGVHEEHIPITKYEPAEETQQRERDYLHGLVLLTFFGWGSERDRERFYTYPLYQRLNAFLHTMSSSRTLSLEPC